MPPRIRVGQASNQMPPKGGTMPPGIRVGQASNQMLPKGG